MADAFATKLNPKLKSADIVIGKITNDATNRVITAYHNGLYDEIGTQRAERTAIGKLLPECLKDQCCFETDAAVAALEFVRADEHDV